MASESVLVPARQKNPRNNKIQKWKGSADDYSLLVGPSLLSQISKGLRQCQYGIVVLSKHFFEKKWPRAELDGLFDLEPADQSLILPI
jgi:TIR domain-containing protein